MEIIDQDPISFERFKTDLADELGHFLFMLDIVLGDARVGRMFDEPKGLPTEHESGGLDLDDFAMGVHARLLHAYAINGRLYHGWHLPGISDSLRALDVICRHNIEAQGYVSDSVEQVWMKATARAKLDNHLIDNVSHTSAWADSPLTIEDVAYLCDMSPASVRNSTTKNAKDPLKTHREGGKVFVDIASLIDWLSRRRSYRKTELIEVEAEENMNFRSLDELAEFLSTRILNRKPEVEAIIACLGIEESTATRLRFGQAPDLNNVDIDSLIGYARLLELTEGDFIERATRVLLDQKLKTAGLLPAGEVIPMNFRHRSGRGKS